MAFANFHTIKPASHNPDAPYWARLKSGDPAALGYLYDRYVDTLFAVAIRLTENRELAQDSIQEVFVELWQYRAGIGTVDHSLAYLQKSLRNKLFRQLKKALRHTEMAGAETFASPDANGEESMVAFDQEKENNYRLSRALSLLTQRQREIVTLHFYEGLTYEQIAERLRMNYQSVNNLAYRSMLRLRDHMILILLIGILLR